MTLQLITTNQFNKELKKLKKRGKDTRKLTDIVRLLVDEKTLPKKYRNHKLKGEYKGCWECHIEPDWLLIYTKTKDYIALERTGTHTDLFK